MISLVIIPGIIGAFCVALNKCNTANIIWSFSNLFMVAYNYSHGDISQCVLFGVYEIISLYGVTRYFISKES